MSVGRFALTHSRGVLAIALLLAALGLQTLWHVPLAILPDFPYPRIAVIADAGDVAIETMVQRVTRPLESAAAVVPGVTRVRSRTARGSVEMSVDFDWNEDMFQALTYLRGSIDSIRDDLPSGVSLVVERQDPSSFPVIGYSLTSPTVDQATLRELADLQVAPTLSRLRGVYRVLVQGGDVREFTVAARPEALAAAGVSIADVTAAIEDTNQVSSVGRFDKDHMKYLVVGTAEMRGVDDVRSAVVATKGDVPIRVRDVADVFESSEERITAVTANGQPAVLVSVLKQPGASVVAVSDELKEAFGDLAHSLPAGIEIRPFYDESDLVREAIGSVRDAVILGAVLAAMVLVAFLGSGRASAAVLLTLPITVLITLLLLRVLGETLNLMTLGGLAVGLGLIIDDVVVTVENIHRHVQEGKGSRQAAVDGTSEITRPMIGSSLTTICVFLPLLAVGGITGAFFAPLALTLTVMLLASMVLAITVAPALCARLLRVEEGHDAASGRMYWLVRLVRRGYAPLLRLVLRHRWETVGVSVLLALATVAIYRSLPTGFMPEMDEGAFILDYWTPDGTSLAETDRQLRVVEEILMSQPEIEAYSRRTGLELGFFATEQNTGDFAVKLKPRSQRQRGIQEVIEDTRARVSKALPGLLTEFVLIIQDRVADMAGVPEPIEVKVFGSDPARLQELAPRVSEVVGEVPGVVDVSPGVTRSGPELIVRIDPARAGRAGLRASDVLDQLSTSMFGQGGTFVRRGEQSIPIRVTYPPSLRRTEEQVRRIELVSPTGKLVPLTAIADVSEGTGSAEQEREDQKPLIAVTASLEGVDLGTGVRRVQQAVAENIVLPPGYSVHYGGLFETQQQSFRRLLLVFLFGMALVFVVAVCQYEAFAEPMALFLAAAFSEVGVVLALRLTHTPFNASSFTGAIMVFGMVLTNGIVLMDYIRQRTRLGMPLAEAAAEAGRIRVRPVLMTSTIAILALLPLALGIGAGAEMQKPLAIAVIGGLMVSPFFALLLAPALLTVFRSRQFAHGRQP